MRIVLVECEAGRCVEFSIMATISVTLADELKNCAETQAAEAGYPSIDAYLANLIESDTAIPVDAELEAHLVAGALSPVREMTVGDWSQKQKTLTEKLMSSRQ
jgi:hypothetical protein